MALHAVARRVEGQHRARSLGQSHRQFLTPHAGNERAALPARNGINVHLRRASA